MHTNFSFTNLQHGPKATHRPGTKTFAVRLLCEHLESHLWQTEFRWNRSKLIEPFAFEAKLWRNRSKRVQPLAQQTKFRRNRSKLVQPVAFETKLWRNRSKLFQPFTFKTWSHRRRPSWWETCQQFHSSYAIQQTVDSAEFGSQLLQQ